MTTVTRGPESWTYIYIVLGFVISIEGTIIQMTPLTWPWNVIAYVVVAGLTGYAFIEWGWLHNILIGLKGRYENKPRSPY